MQNETLTTYATNEVQTATNRVYHQLRAKIIKGEFIPEEKLKIEALKPLFDTGASPIREALSLLTSDNLVERIDQRGFRVTPISKANFNEILMLRCKLDDMALRASIELGNSDWEEALVLSHYRLKRADMADFDQWETLHKTFHMSLLNACNSSILLSYCSQLYDQNIRYRFLAESSTNYKSRNVTDEHQHILDATINRDADLASQLLLQHYTSTGEFLLKRFNDNQNGVYL